MQRGGDAYCGSRREHSSCPNPAELRARFQQCCTFTTAVALGAEKEARAFVQTLTDGKAKLRDSVNGTDVYEVPKAGLAISRLFRELEANKQRLQITNHALEHPVFLHVVNTCTD